MVALDSLYHDHGGITLSVPCGISSTQSVFQWYWTVCISVALDGLYLVVLVIHRCSLYFSGIGQSGIGWSVPRWHWTACILVALNSLYISGIKQSVAISKQPQRFDVLSTGCYTCTGGNSKGCAAVWQNRSCHVIQASSQCSSAGYADFGSGS